MNNIPLIIYRCLSECVRIYPYELEVVIFYSEKFKIPDDILQKLKKDDLTKYIKALYLSSLESARDWSEGHKILKELGFIEKIREDGHRNYISLIWNDLNTRKNIN